MYHKYLILLIFVFLQVGNATALDFKTRTQTQLLEPANDAYKGLKVTFFGTSAFLLDDGVTQILIDGFVTRAEDIRLFGKFAPDLGQIEDIIRDHKICRSRKIRKTDADIVSCRTSKDRGLDVVIPVHAHYDHALDAPYFAAWAGADIIGDSSIEKIYDATRGYAPLKPDELNWSEAKLIPPFEKHRKRGIHTYGSFKITLIKSDHIKTIVHLPILGEIKRELTFPTTLASMKEGTNFSVHVEHGKKRFVIVPSAGVFDKDVYIGDLTADVVFLGIGAAGIKLPYKRRMLWNKTVPAMKASRVIPIHWDTDKEVFKKEQINFKLATPRRFDATIKIFDQLAERDNVEIIFAPPNVAFDPFQFTD